MARQKMISISKLGEIVDLMRTKGVAKLHIPETVDLELYAFAVEQKAIPVAHSYESGDDEMSEQDLLMMSAR